MRSWGFSPCLAENSYGRNSAPPLFSRLRKNTKTNIRLGDTLVLGQMARQIDPVNIFNVVVSGKAAKLKGQDVVLVNSSAMIGLLGDVSHDAIPDGR